MIYKKYGEIICDFNFDKILQERMKNICPLNKEKLFVHQVIQDWCPTLLSKLDDIRAALKEKAEGNAELTKNLETVDLV